MAGSLSGLETVQSISGDPPLATGPAPVVEPAEALPEEAPPTEDSPPDPIDEPEDMLFMARGWSSWDSSSEWNWANGGLGVEPGPMV